LIIKDHAIGRLYKRYEKYGLDVEFAIQEIKKLTPEDENYRLIIIDDVPIVLATHGNIVDTAYPHPFEAARDNRLFLKELKSLRYSINHQDKHILKLEKKLKLANQKLRKLWN
jgi:hypothetical protein